MGPTHPTDATGRVLPDDAQGPDVLGPYLNKPFTLHRCWSGPEWRWRLRLAIPGVPSDANRHRIDERVVPPDALGPDAAWAYDQNTGNIRAVFAHAEAKAMGLLNEPSDVVTY